MTEHVPAGPAADGLVACRCGALVNPERPGNHFDMHKIAENAEKRAEISRMFREGKVSLNEARELLRRLGTG